MGGGKLFEQSNKSEAMKKNKQNQDANDSRAKNKTADKMDKATTTRPDEADIEEFKERKKESKLAGEEEIHSKEQSQKK